MTKLYSNGALWQVPGRQDKTAERIDIPNSPDQLAAWLNDRRVSPAGSELAGVVPMNSAADELLEEIRGPSADGIEPIGNPNRCANCKAVLIATPEGADKAAISRTLTQIGDWMDTAPDWALMNLVEIINEKAADYRNRQKGRAN